MRLHWRWLALISISLISTLLLSARPAPSPRRVGQDVALHSAVVRDLQQGTPYYAAAAHELGTRGYPTRSVVNWRTPALSLALARFPRLMAGLFLLLAVAVLMATIHLLRSAPVFVPVVAAGVQIITVPAAGQARFFHEMWVGALLFLAVWAYANSRGSIGAVLVLAALLLRELVMPFALLCAGLAWYRHQRSERTIWLAGLAGYAVYYGSHVWMVLQVMPPNAVGHAGSYFSFGGLPATLAAVHASPLLYALPGVATAVVFALAVIGLTARYAPAHLRCLVGTYIVLFAIIGHSFNWYWGWMISPAISAVAAMGLSEMLTTTERRPGRYGWRSVPVAAVGGTE